MPDYWLIKNSDWWALFSNVANLDWGVFNTTSLPLGMNLPDEDNSFIISHVTEFDGEGGGGGEGNVPEPTVIALFGMGLLGMGLSRIRKKRKTS